MFTLLPFDNDGIDFSSGSDFESFGNIAPVYDDDIPDVEPPYMLGYQTNAQSSPAVPLSFPTITLPADGDAKVSTAAAVPAVSTGPDKNFLIGAAILGGLLFLVMKK